MVTMPLEGLSTRNSATGAEADRLRVKMPVAATVAKVSDVHIPVAALQDWGSASPSLRPLAPR